MPHSCFIHSSADEHSGCFRLLAVVNSAAVNIGAHVCFRIRVLALFKYLPRRGTAGSQGSSSYKFPRKLSTALPRGTLGVPDSSWQELPLVSESPQQRAPGTLALAVWTVSLLACSLGPLPHPENSCLRYENVTDSQGFDQRTPLSSLRLSLGRGPAGQREESPFARLHSRPPTVSTSGKGAVPAVSEQDAKWGLTSPTPDWEAVSEPLARGPFLALRRSPVLPAIGAPTMRRRVVTSCHYCLSVIPSSGFPLR